MKRYCGVWSTIATDACRYKSLDVAQLIKHAFAIRTQIHRGRDEGRKGVLNHHARAVAEWAGIGD